jgi:hypothetical protein
LRDPYPGDCFRDGHGHYRDGDNTYKDADILIDGGTLALVGPKQFRSIQVIHGGSLRYDPMSGETAGMELTVAEEVIKVHAENSSYLLR